MEMFLSLLLLLVNSFLIEQHAQIQGSLLQQYIGIGNDARTHVHNDVLAGARGAFDFAICILDPLGQSSTANEPRSFEKINVCQGS